jgi:hypothetical protein
MTNRSHETGSPPRTTARLLLCAAMLGACYLDFFAYRAQGWADAVSLPALTARLRGVADAPDQYRLGVLWLANLLATHLHVAMTMSLAAIDGVCGLVALLTLFSVLERSAVYARAGALLQWFGAAVFVLLAEWFLAWLLWLQKPETLPAAMLVALMLWLWGPSARRPRTALTAAGLVLLNLALASFRADAGCLLNLGILLFVCAHPAAKLALPRRAATAVSFTSALAALGVQLWLMRGLFPQAGYGRVKLWQLWPNLKHATRWPPFVLFLLPLLWLAVQMARRRFREDPASVALLWGGLLFAALWAVIGKIDEVRIFLPFALALTPLTAQVAMDRIGLRASAHPSAEAE